VFTAPLWRCDELLVRPSALVAVGRDRVQHVERPRDGAGYFNNTFKVKVFPPPQERLDEFHTVPGTDGKKMSKSYGNTIDIFAEGNPLKKSVMGIVTDSKPLGTPLDPTTCNVFALYSLFASEQEKAALAERYRAGTVGYGDAKGMLLEKINAYFGPFRQKRKDLAARPEYLEEVLRRGARKARAEARKTMELVRQAVGMTGQPVEVAG